MLALNTSLINHMKIIDIFCQLIFREVIYDWFCTLVLHTHTTTPSATQQHSCEEVSIPFFVCVICYFGNVANQFWQLRSTFFYDVGTSIKLLSLGLSNLFFSKQYLTLVRRCIFEAFCLESVPDLWIRRNGTHREKYWILSTRAKFCMKGFKI